MQRRSPFLRFYFSSSIISLFSNFPWKLGRSTGCVSLQTLHCGNRNGLSKLMRAFSWPKFDGGVRGVGQTESYAARTGLRSMRARSLVVGDLAELGTKNAAGASNPHERVVGCPK